LCRSEEGSHTIFRHENPDTDEGRTMMIPKADPIPTGTLHNIADQAGVDDFYAFWE
jgi:predicted RNA binding protein YcfA (HicA-like mRNA interferase family)